MQRRTKEQLRAAADQIVLMIVRTAPEQRWELYTLVSERLLRNAQNYQASHFTAMAEAETRGTLLEALKK